MSLSQSKLPVFVLGFVCGAVVVGIAAFYLQGNNPTSKSGPGYELNKLDFGELDLDVELIRECAMASKDVYTKPEDPNVECNYLGRYKVVTWGGESEEEEISKSIMILHDDDRKIQILAIAGSDSFEDWRNNSKYPFKESLGNTGLMVHRKFMTLAVEIYKHVISEGKLEKGYKTICTGHSLGGAVAAMIGLLIKSDPDNEIDLQTVITFGQPKFTNINRDEDDPLDNRSGVYVARDFPLLRVVNPDDPIPTFPPYSLLKEAAGTGRYSHCGDKLLLTCEGRGILKLFMNAGKINEDNLDKSDPSKLFDSATKAIFKRKEHSMDSYLKNLGVEVSNGGN